MWILELEFLIVLCDKVHAKSGKSSFLKWGLCLNLNIQSLKNYTSYYISQHNLVFYRRSRPNCVWNHWDEQKWNNCDQNIQSDQYDQLVTNKVTLFTSDVIIKALRLENCWLSCSRIRVQREDDALLIEEGKFGSARTEISSDQTPINKSAGRFYQQISANHRYTVSTHMLSNIKTGLFLQDVIKR